jgi:hypothetical protein
MKKIKIKKKNEKIETSYEKSEIKKKNNPNILSNVFSYIISTL